MILTNIINILLLNTVVGLITFIISLFFLTKFLVAVRK